MNGTRIAFLGPADGQGTTGPRSWTLPRALIEVEVRKGGLTGRGQVTVTAGGVAALEVTLAEETPPPAP